MHSCKLFNSKRMECQIGEKGACGICIKMPCKGSGECKDVQILCCGPEDLEKCCKDPGKSAGNVCCICMLCEDGKIKKTVVRCCGESQEMSPKDGNGVNVCVPRTEGGKCAGKVQLKECQPAELNNCTTKDNLASGECCCVCLSCVGGTCTAVVCCPEPAGSGQCQLKCC